MKSLEVQVGGDHYKKMKIQPIEFINKNELNFCQGNIIKYATRYKFKNGREDLEKVKHYADLLLDFEYGGDAKTLDDLRGIAAKEFEERLINETPTIPYDRELKEAKEEITVLKMINSNSEDWRGDYVKAKGNEDVLMTAMKKIRDLAGHDPKRYEIFKLADTVIKNVEQYNANKN